MACLALLYKGNPGLAGWDIRMEYGVLRIKKRYMVRVECDMTDVWLIYRRHCRTPLRYYYLMHADAFSAWRKNIDRSSSRIGVQYLIVRLCPREAENGISMTITKQTKSKL